MTTARYLIGDVFDRMADIPDHSIDFIMTSPPFYRLRSYLPDGHPNKGKEIGSEPTPVEYIDTLLALTAEWGRLLAPHGSICVELGDTYAGSGGAGGDYNADGLRDGQPQFDGSASKAYGTGAAPRPIRIMNASDHPMEKSLLGIPDAYALSLEYGWNVLHRNAPDSPAGRWRVRNKIAWVRPNPPVGALGDKFRPATSYLTIACRARDRYFDLDAVRVPSSDTRPRNTNGPKSADAEAADVLGHYDTRTTNPAGAPPLDWWNIPPRGYDGAHYAVYPPELCTRPIQAMTPRRVCVTCGLPTRRITVDRSAFDRQPELAAHIKNRREAAGITSAEINEWFGYKEIAKNWERTDRHGAAIPNPDDWPLLADRLGLDRERFDDLVLGERRWAESTTEHIQHGTNGAKSAAHREGPSYTHRATAIRSDLGWSDCGHNTWRPGHVLDPFAGTGTTLLVATGHGHTATGIDIDQRNAALALERVGPLLLTIDPGTKATA